MRYRRKLPISKFARQVSYSSHNIAAPYDIDTTGWSAHRINHAALKNFVSVVYTSLEFGLCNRLFEKSPEFGELQRILVWSS